MGYNFIAKQGNLLTEEVATFIVNPSNTKLLLGSGVSMAFSRHCGNKLQHEMIQSLKKIDEPLKQGYVVATSSGQASNFQYALHAAIMDYNPGVKQKDKSPTLDVIRRSLINIEAYLEWYTQQNDKTIKLVLPLMGCGVGGLDKEEVLKLYCTFFNRDIPFTCEVVIYGYTMEDYNLIKKICVY